MTAPWLPPRVPGFGPWIEATVIPDGLESSVKMQALTDEEQRAQYFFPLEVTAEQLRGEAGVVAYCVEEV